MHTHEGWPGWVDDLTYLNGLSARRRSPIPVLTGLDVVCNFVDLDQRAVYTTKPKRTTFQCSVLTDAVDRRRPTRNLAVMLGIIMRHFKHLTKPTFILICKTMVRSHIDYCCSVWAPYKKGDNIEALEKVQKMATKILPTPRHLTYPDRLKACNLTTLHYRPIRGDMIENYKIIYWKYDSAIAPTLQMSDTHKTRGNDFLLQKFRSKYDILVR